ncbi:antibiotic biosynthesis monooxygenase family protein [Actinomadura roseirufa]|uniref:antibiotic biosynthesis monooxygenase family protein n=1 Tax=Actinomadura roseirufa TaxID=2094049 RepID=UPI00104109C1|nr:antibiotic biosynthesis monooxygenase family protein [Actinomadura roseirufa]
MSGDIGFEGIELNRSNLDGPVTLINAFTVPPGESERFLTRWRDNVRAMSGQPGFIRAVMYRALDESVETAFVNVAEWESGKALDAAREDPGWRAAVHRILDDPELHIIARPIDYRVELDVRPGDEV